MEYKNGFIIKNITMYEANKFRKSMSTLSGNV